MNIVLQKDYVCKYPLSIDTFMCIPETALSLAGMFGLI